MIINASGRTDICAFYSEWFMKRIKAGYFDVRNPFHETMVSRIYWENVDLVMFCTKNPLPMIPNLPKIDKPVLMDVTITPYHREIEPNVPDKKEVIEGVRQASEILGPKNVVVRYDPIFLSSRYTLEYHLRAFEKLCAALEGAVERICISFLDEYKNVRNNLHILNPVPFREEDYQCIAEEFLRIAQKHKIIPYTCHEKDLLTRYGFPNEACLSSKRAFEMTGKVFKTWKARDCGCAEMADIGAYNSCRHLCRYCYANFDERKAALSSEKHNPESSLLIGELRPQDQVIRRFGQS